MTKLERVQAALKREPTDRPPYAFWRHFPDVDRSAAALAQSTLRFHERYGSDFLKVTPTGGYAVEDWGCVESDEVAPDGHRPCARHAVNEPRRLEEDPPAAAWSRPAWGSHLETIIRCVVDRRADCSTLPTIFSPLSLARKLSGERLNYDLKENPQAVTDALEAITETIVDVRRRLLPWRARRASSTRSWRRAPTCTPRTSTGASASPTTGASSRRCARSPSSPSCTATASHLMFDRLASPARPRVELGRPPRRARRCGRRRPACPGAVIGGLDQWGALQDAAAGGRDAPRRRMRSPRPADAGSFLGAGCVLPIGHLGR